MKHYVVLFPYNLNSRSSWVIVEARTPKEAVSSCPAGSVRTDDKALVIQLDKDPIPVYAKVDWSE